MKIVLREFEPLGLDALRFTFAAMPVWVLLRVRGRPALPPQSEWLRLMWFGRVGHVIFQIAFTYGIAR